MMLLKMCKYFGVRESEEKTIKKFNELEKLMTLKMKNKKLLMENLCVKK